MLDLVVRGGTIVDGSGAPSFTGDVGVRDGLITEVSRSPGALGAARRVIDAEGALVTPGFVDVHTHYDGQVTWDPWLTPSSWHGVTTAVMGNCGVGFAPVRADRRDWLISVMEGVEDIPGPVLAEGIRWDWETFPEYLDALERRPLAVDVGAQLPHSALRAWVMGERALTHEEAGSEDIRQMAALTREALRAGALGFSTTRTLIHKYAGHKYPPGTFCPPDEMLGLARAIADVGHGVFQMTSNHTQMESELWWLREVARITGQPVSFALVQTDQTPDMWKDLLAAVDQAQSEGLPLYGAVSARPAGILMSFQGTIHPFRMHPAWRELAGLAWPERLAALRDPVWRERLTDMAVLTEAGRRNPSGAYFTQTWARMFPLGSEPDYEPAPEDSVAARAQREGRTPAQVAYDCLLADEGEAMLYFPSFNYAYHDLSQLHAQLQNPHTLLSLADGGAHCGYICDASMPTFMLTHWARDRRRGPTLPLELMVQRQTRDTARVYGLQDRGLIAAGLRADLNIIDFGGLRLDAPRVVFDLPAGGRRLVQSAQGYRATLVAGVPTFEHGECTGALPGRLLRGPRRAALPVAA